MPKKKNLDKLEEGIKTLELLLRWTNECIKSVNKNINENIIKELNKGDKNEF